MDGPVDVVCKLAPLGRLLRNLCELGVPEHCAGVGVVGTVSIVQCEPHLGIGIRRLGDCIGTSGRGACGLAARIKISMHTVRLILSCLAYRLTKGEARVWTASEATIRANERMMSE